MACRRPHTLVTNKGSHEGPARRTTGRLPHTRHSLAGGRPHTPQRQVGRRVRRDTRHCTLRGSARSVRVHSTAVCSRDKTRTMLCRVRPATVMPSMEHPVLVPLVVALDRCARTIFATHLRPVLVPALAPALSSSCTCSTPASCGGHATVTRRQFPIAHGSSSFAPRGSVAVGAWRCHQTVVYSQRCHQTVVRLIGGPRAPHLHLRARSVGNETHAPRRLRPATRRLRGGHVAAT